MNVNEHTQDGFRLLKKPVNKATTYTLYTDRAIVKIKKIPMKTTSKLRRRYNYIVTVKFVFNNKYYFTKMKAPLNKALVYAKNIFISRNNYMIAHNNTCFELGGK